MSSTVTFQINGKKIAAAQGETILEACRKSGVDIPTMCYLEGLSAVGACRLCVVEIEGSPKLFPACTTPVLKDMAVRTETEKLHKYRRMITELFFCERNHVCAVCVANNHCELQELGYKVGMDHVRFPYLFPDLSVDATHKDYVKDDNRCIMCTRCVRVCAEVEGAHNWDVMGRGHNSRIVADFMQPWGESETCTSCGKCIEVCPTGALWPKDATQMQRIEKKPAFITELIEKKKRPS